MFLIQAEPGFNQGGYGVFVRIPFFGLAYYGYATPKSGANQSILVGNKPLFPWDDAEGLNYYHAEHM